MRISFYLSLFFCAALSFSAAAQTDQNLLYGSFFGGSTADFVSSRNSMASLGNGEWVMVGTSVSSDFWISDDAFQQQINTLFGPTPFLSRFNSSGMPTYSTFFGGSQPVQGILSVAASPSGDKYCFCGRTASDDFPVTDGAHNTVLEGEWSGFISCFDNDNELLWSTFLGNSELDGVTDVSVVSDGVYVSGATRDIALGTPGTFAPDFPDGSIVSSFVSKFDLDGNLIWLSYYYGSESTPSMAHIETSHDGSRVYVYGSAVENSVPATQGGHQEDFGGGSVDVGLACFSADNGTLLWSTYFGGEGDESSGGLALGSDGSVYISGHTDSESQIATEGVHQEEYVGMGDWFFAKFTSEGELVWGTYFGGEGDEDSFFTALSFSNEGLYFTGNTTSATGLTFGNPFEPEIDGGSVASSMAKFNPADGTLIWATYIGAEESACRPARFHTPVGEGRFAVSANVFGPVCASYNTDNAFQPFFPGGDNSLWYGILEENTLSVNNAEAALQARLFPNPASSEVFIDLPGLLFSVMDVQVFDLAGRLVLSTENLNQGGALNTSSLGDGMYVLHVSAKGKMYTGKLTVTR